jgi:hypothetical protein
MKYAGCGTGTLLPARVVSVQHGVKRSGMTEKDIDRLVEEARNVIWRKMRASKLR